MNKDKIKEIKRLREKGFTYKKIAEELKLSISIVDYYANEEGRKKRIKSTIERFKKLPEKKKKEIYNSRKEYIKNYMKNRYKTDEIFREKVKKKSREYNSNRAERRLKK